ncbi:hypothetical protein [Paenibacillus sp. IHBB 10380]|uniref:hypothetical protein n=1 Tax=Paenibacillus sp. IHBB 10380 TaxID=1566358 RepID=UPI0011858CF5|nr:hypothetical protein [Paenibacillus sp. IHBB 10380]
MKKYFLLIMLMSLFMTNGVEAAKDSTTTSQASSLSSSSNFLVSNISASHTQPKPNEDNSPNRIPTSGAVLIGLGSLIVIVLIGTMGVILGLGNGRRKQIRQVGIDLAELMVQANHMLDSIQSFKGISQGVTGEMVEGIIERLSNSMIELSRIQSEMSTVQISITHLSTLKASYEHFLSEHNRMKAFVTAEEIQVDVVIKADRTLKQKKDAVKKQVSSLNEDIKTSTENRDLTPAVIQGQLDQIDVHISKVEELEMFDPLAALTLLEVIEQKIGQVRKDVFQK